MANCDNTNFFIQSIVSRLIKIESKLITRYCASIISCAAISHLVFGGKLSVGHHRLPETSAETWTFVWNFWRVGWVDDDTMNFDGRQWFLVPVYIGGLGGLFLGEKPFFVSWHVITGFCFFSGCSLLGFTELIFFFTWGMIKNLIKYFKKSSLIDVNP